MPDANHAACLVERDKVDSWTREFTDEIQKHVLWMIAESGPVPSPVTRWAIQFSWDGQRPPVAEVA